jgi:hypothetical protein
MATFNKFNDFVQQLLLGVHNLDLGGTSTGATVAVVKVYLTTAVPSATNSIKADVVEIAPGQGNYSTGGADIQNSVGRTGGTAIMTSVDVVWTGTGTGFGPFRYVVAYNDTPTTPADPLIGFYDYGSNVSVGDQETFTVDFGTAVFDLA